MGRGYNGTRGAKGAVNWNSGIKSIKSIVDGTEYRVSKDEAEAELDIEGIGSVIIMRQETKGGDDYGFYIEVNTSDGDFYSRDAEETANMFDAMSIGREKLISMTNKKTK